METMKNLCINQNICIICTLHQTSSDVLSMIDYLYVLTKGGHNVFCGPTQELYEFLDEFSVIDNNFSDSNQIPIETLVRLSTKGIQYKRLVVIKEITSQVVKDSIKYVENNLINTTIIKTTKKFCYKDLIHLIENELIEILQYKYTFYLMHAFILLISSVLISNAFGPDIGKYDDCFGFHQNITCEQRQLNINMVDRNANFLSMAFWLSSFIQMTLTIHDKSRKTVFFYHHRQNS